MGLSNFKRMCPHEVVIQTKGPDNKHGEGTGYVTVATFKARVVDGKKRVRDADGVLVESDRHVYVAGDYAIGPEDRVVLPAGYTPQYPPIKTVARYPDKKGAHHMVIYL